MDNISVDHFILCGFKPATRDAVVVSKMSTHHYAVLAGNNRTAILLEEEVIKCQKV